MKTKTYIANLIAILVCLLGIQPATAGTNLFFNASQTATVVLSNQATITINSGDYQFTYSQDGYWSSAPGGTPTGRFFYISWPTGVQAQSYTAGPLIGTGSSITLKRIDGKRFGLQAFSGKILLNTAATGAAFEVMPQVNGEDAFADPLMYDCTGYFGWTFPYTTALSGYDIYKIHMWGDFALTALTLVDTNISTSVTTTNTITVNISPVGAGAVVGVGAYSSNSTCTLIASANSGWGFQKWTENGVQVSALSSYSFTVRSNRTLVANFVPLPPNLSLERSATNSLLLSWPATGIPFVLQENSTVSDIGWTDSTALINVIGTNNQAVIAPMSGEKFFRLKLP